MSLRMFLFGFMAVTAVGCTFPKVTKMEPVDQVNKQEGQQRQQDTPAQSQSTRR